MKIFEDYENLFFDPRDFANDKLGKHAWPWWAYALVLLTWSILSLVLIAVFIPAVGHVDWTPVIILAIIGYVFMFLGILIINEPFRYWSGLKRKEYFQACLAFLAYTVPIGIAIRFVGIISFDELMTLFLAAYNLTFFDFIQLAIYPLGAIVNIWLLVSGLKIVSEIHQTKVWKVLVMVISTLIVLSIIYGMLRLALHFP